MAKTTNTTGTINGFSVMTASDMKTTTVGSSMSEPHARLLAAYKEMKEGTVIAYPVAEGKKPKNTINALNAFFKERANPRPKVSLHAEAK